MARKLVTVDLNNTLPTSVKLPTESIQSAITEIVTNTPELRGPKGDSGGKGDKGDKGLDGVTPNIQVKTILVGQDSSISVEKTGTNSDPLFTFSIPSLNNSLKPLGPDGSVLSADSSSSSGYSWKVISSIVPLASNQSSGLMSNTDKKSFDDLLKPTYQTEWLGTPDKSRSSLTSTQLSSPFINNITNPGLRSDSQKNISTGLKRFGWTVATYNVRSASLSETSPTNSNEKLWAERVPSLALDVIASGASFVGLQEADGTSQTTSNPVFSSSNSLAKTISPAWESMAVGVGGTAFIWDSSIWEYHSNFQAFELDYRDAVLAPGEGSIRLGSLGVFKHKETSEYVLMVNVHLPTGLEANTIRQREAATRNLVNIVLGVNKKLGSLPVIIYGDFNTSQGLNSGGIFEITDTAFFATSRSYSSFENSTYNSYNNFEPSMAEYSNGLCLDHILYSKKDFKILNAGQTMRFADGVSVPLAQPIGSDHFLSWTKFERLPALPDSNGTVLYSQAFGGSAKVFLSNKFCSFGEKAVEVVSTGNTSGSWYVSGVGVSNASYMRYLEMYPGKTYYVSAKIYIDIPLTSAGASPNSPFVGVGWNRGNLSSNVTWEGGGKLSAVNSSGLGWQTVYNTITIPTDATNVFIRALNGSAVSGESVWFKDFLVVDVTNRVPLDVALLSSIKYFDGNSRNSVHQNVKEYIVDSSSIDLPYSKQDISSLLPNVGYRSIPLSAGFTTHTFGNTPSAKRKGLDVSLRGVILKTGSNIAVSDVLCTLAPGISPKTVTYFTVRGGGNTLFNLQVNSNGTISIGSIIGDGSAWISLDAINYSVM